MNKKSASTGAIGFFKRVDEGADKGLQWFMVGLTLTFQTIWKAVKFALTIVAMMLGALLRGLEICCGESTKVWHAWYSAYREHTFIRKARRLFEKEVPNNEQAYIEKRVQFIQDAIAKKLDRKIPAESLAECLIRLYEPYLSPTPFSDNTAPERSRYRQLVRTIESITSHELARELMKNVLTSPVRTVAPELIEDLLARTKFKVTQKYYKQFSVHMIFGNELRHRRMSGGTDRGDVTRSPHDLRENAPKAVRNVFRKNEPGLLKKMQDRRKAAWWDTYPFGKPPEQNTGSST